MPRAPPREKLDWTKSRFEPRLVICSEMVASVPALMATMIMTAATPMMMPSIVRNERTLFLRTASQAMRMISVSFILRSLLCHFLGHRFMPVMVDLVDLPVGEMDHA